MANITAREQLLVLLVIGIVLLGSYGLFRYMPQNKTVQSLQQTLAKNVDKVKNPTFPDEPTEDVERLKENAEGLVHTLTGLRASVDNFEKNLAPIGSQDALLKISEAARIAGVKVIENVPYFVARRGEDATVVTTERKLNKRAKRALAKKLARGKQVYGAGQAGSTVVGAIPKEGELIDRVVNELEEARPMQRMSVEGSYTSLQLFIQSLQRMPWQITVMKLDIDVNIQTPPQGIPQPIMARMIVAM